MSTVHIPNHQGVVNGVGLYSVSMHSESPYETYDGDVPDPAWVFTPTLPATSTPTTPTGSCRPWRWC